MTLWSMADLRRRVGPTLIAALCVLGAVMGRAEAAAPTLRYQTDQRGDFILFGNTGGYDCRDGIPAPVVGSVDRTKCFKAVNVPAFIDDTSSDVGWRSEDNSATANVDIAPEQVRSTAVLQIPSGATISYARLYWSSSLRERNTPGSSIVIDRPGKFTQTLSIADAALERVGASYQASADVTRILQAYGAGAYRVAGIPKNEFVDRIDDNNYVVWSMVVVYKRDADPIRNITIFDGLYRVDVGLPVQIPLKGFAVPPQGSTDSKLGVIGYEGDHDLKGDNIKFNGVKLTNGAAETADNFFSSSRTNFGQPVTVVGDLPQMNGAAGSMNGLDLHVVNITPQLKANDTSATIEVQTVPTLNPMTGSVEIDYLYTGAFVTAITSKKPILDTQLVPSNSKPHPGDEIEFTSTTKNIGDDTATDVVIEHPLPPGLTYVPGSVRVTGGPNQGPKTDMPNDDQVELVMLPDPLNPGNTVPGIRIRIGNGANASKGGTIPAQPQTGSDPSNIIVVKYKVRIGDDTVGEIPTQSTTVGTPTGNPSAGPMTYPSGDGTHPNTPTVINVPECQTNADCSIGAPVCNTKVMPHRCVNTCTTDADCKGAAGGQEVCDTAAMKCVVCTATNPGTCTPDGQGKACIIASMQNNRCGCNTDADCGGRKCDTAAKMCPKPVADLHVNVTQDPNPANPDQPVRYKVTVTNKGPGTAPPSTVFDFDVPSGGTIESVDPGPGWRCSTTERKVTCTYQNPIGPNATTPEVVVTVRPDPVNPGNGGNGGGPQPPIKGTVKVGNDNVDDPNPSDNTVTIETSLGRYKVAGGGFGCSMSRDGGALGLWSALGMAAAMMLLFSRLRRKQESAS